jgi:hypothetical protein
METAPAQELCKTCLANNSLPRHGFCIKNHYLIVGRQAMKRTTTYSGKLHAFNAKLQTDAMLKKTKSN